VGVLEPDPRSDAIVCERLGVAREQSVFVDNVAGAPAIGMQGILFVATQQAIGELRALLRQA
jgi:FMN phosphatase YigB (HAD superfamily)